MSWSEVQEGKKKVKHIVHEIDPQVECEIFEPVGEDFDRKLYPVILKKGRLKGEFKLSMEDLEDVVEDATIQRKIWRTMKDKIQEISMSVTSTH